MRDNEVIGPGRRVPFECDCGQVYYSSAAVLACQGNNHGQPSDRPDIDLESYQRFVLDIWEDSPSEPGGRMDMRGLLICIAGLSGEHGEVGEHVKAALEIHADHIELGRAISQSVETAKKHARDGRDVREKIQDEMGDVLYYTVRLARHFGLSLEDLATANWNKLVARYGR